MEEEAEVEVPLFQKRRKLMKVGDMVQVREGASSEKVVPARDGAGQREKKREAGEDASAWEEPWSRKEIEKVRAELPLVVVPFK